MKILIVEDEFVSRTKLKYLMDEYGNCDIAVDGTEAVEAFKIAADAKKPYDLICLDIKLPGKDGHQTLEEIRSIEEEMGISLNNPVKVFMTTAMGDIENVSKSYQGLCDEYLQKPIEKKNLDEMVTKHNLV